MRRSIVSALEEESRSSFLTSRPATRTPEDGSHRPNADVVDADDDRESRPTSPVASVLDFAKIVWDVTTQNTQAPVAHERIVLFMVVVWLAVIAVISYGSNVLSLETQRYTVGIVVNLNLVFFYGAPLSTILTVLRTQSSATIHVPTTITNTLNGTFWAAFGIATLDWFIAVPNGLGGILGVLQGILCLAFPRQGKKIPPSAVRESHQSRNDVDAAALAHPDSVDARLGKTQPIDNGSSSTVEHHNPVLTDDR